MRTLLGDRLLRLLALREAVAQSVHNIEDLGWGPLRFGLLKRLALSFRGNQFSHRGFIVIFVGSQIELRCPCIDKFLRQGKLITIYGRFLTAVSAEAGSRSSSSQ
jgi:hypothetical protein